MCACVCVCSKSNLIWSLNFFGDKYLICKKFSSSIRYCQIQAYWNATLAQSDELKPETYGRSTVDPSRSQTTFGEAPLRSRPLAAQCRRTVSPSETTVSVGFIANSGAVDLPPLPAKPITRRLLALTKTVISINVILQLICASHAIRGNRYVPVW